MASDSRRASVPPVSSYPSPLAPWLKLRVNHLSRSTTPLPAILARTARTPCRFLARAGGSQPGGELLQVARQLPQPRHVGGLVLHQLANLMHHVLGAGPLMHGSAVTQCVQLTLDLIGYRVGMVARLHLFALPPIFGGVPLRVGHHAIDLLFRQLGRTADGDTLLLAAGFVARRDRENPIGINIEGDVDRR